MMDTDQPSWWRGFCAGELDGFTRLIEAFEGEVFAVAYATVLDRSLAEDVAQETFIAAYTHRERLRSPDAVGSWLAAIARNRGRDLLRARKRERLVEMPAHEIASEAECLDRQLDRALLCRQVQRALDRVPARYREVLIMYYAHGRSVEAVAHSLGLTEAATLQRLSRGRRMVRAHGLDLHDFIAPPRRKRELVVAVLALLALRRRADAAPARPPRVHAAGVAGLVLVLGLGGAERASGHDPVAPARSRSSTASATPASDADLADRAQLAAAVSASPSASGSPHGPTPRPPATSPVAKPTSRRTRALRSAPPTPVAPPTPARAPVVAGADSIAVEAPTELVARPARPPTEPRPPSVLPPVDHPEAWAQINGLLETAALPGSGDVSFDTVGTVMMVRAGLTDHLAAHVGMTAMDTDQGTGRANANPALGAGLKLGTRLSPRASIAVLAEGAREVSLKNVRTEDGALGRVYAAVTLGTPRRHTTFVAGAASSFDGNLRWRSPIVGVTSLLGWDDHLAFILEAQRFTTPKGTLEGTTVLAVRFHDQAMADNALGVDRVRIDAGALMLDRTGGDYDGLPWLQVGLGW